MPTAPSSAEAPHRAFRLVMRQTEARAIEICRQVMPKPSGGPCLAASSRAASSRSALA